MAGILKYFKPLSKSSSSSSSLPGLLSRKIPAKAIELANVKVTEATKAPRGCSPYLYLMPGQQYEVGKRTAEHGITATLRYYAYTYKHLPQTETTVRCLKGLYKDTLKPKAKSKKVKDTKTGEDQTGDESENSYKEVDEVKEFPRKKTG